MNFIDRARIKNNPRIIERIKNPSEELFEYAINCGYNIGWISDEKFKEFCSLEYFLKKFKDNPTFTKKLKNVDISIDLKPIYKIVFENNPKSFLDFYNNSIINNFDYFATIIDIETLYTYIIENFTGKEIPQEIFSKETITSIEEDIIHKHNIQSIVPFLERIKTMSDNIIRLLEKKILETPTDYFNILNVIIRIIEKNNKSFSKEFYIEYKKNLMKNPVDAENTPNFLEGDSEYQELLLTQNPKTTRNTPLMSLSSSAREKIIKKIREEHIVFDIIPTIYIEYEDICLEIIKHNNKVSNITDITKKNWSPEKLRKLLEYTSYKYHEQTPQILYEDTEYFLSELKKDFSIIRFAPENLKLSLKELAEIYELYINQDSIRITESELLKRNPLVVIKELKSGRINLKDIDITKISFIETIYHEMQKEAEQQNIDLSKTNLPQTFKNTKNYQYMNANGDIETINNYLYININDDIETIKKYIKLKENNNLNYTIIFKLSHLHYGASIISDNINYFKSIKDLKDIYFDFGDQKLFTIEHLIKDDEFLDYCVQDIKKSYLSPFEKFLAVYDIVKRFKRYKKEKDEEDTTVSRNIYLILNNNYIVCAGYARLLADLLKRIGIEATYILTPSKENGETDHAIISVKIKDEKYNLDGIYLSDPTLDNKPFSVKELNPYDGVLFKTKDGEPKTDLKEGESIVANQDNRKSVLDKDTLLSAVMTLKRHIFKNLPHEAELELIQATNLISDKKRKQIEKELDELKIELFKSCLDKKISEIRALKYSDYVSDILQRVIAGRIRKYTDIEMWSIRLFDNFSIALPSKKCTKEEESDYLNSKGFNKSGNVYLKNFKISPDATINDIINELDTTLSELQELELIEIDEEMDEGISI